MDNGDFMIRINSVSLPLDYDETALKNYVSKILKVSEDNIKSVGIFKLSVDARKKNNVHFEATFDVELKKGEQKAASKNSKAKLVEPYIYELPECKKTLKRPIIIGSGPCGLFAGLILAQAGQEPIILERGESIDDRTKTVELFRNLGVLNENSNIQFGEGGAGTFSDGKLNTGTKDKRIRKVLSEFAAHGAPEDIMYLAKPHIGTDMLKTAVKNIRNDIIDLGGKVIFGAKLTDIVSDNDGVKAIKYLKDDNAFTLETDHLILAVGHSARDTFEMLKNKRITMQQKAFSMGVRIEHLQESISKQQFGSFYNHPRLKAADYKLAVHTKSGRGVYTFCMCPGGTVVAAASENEALVTNGMSEYARDKTNANSALLVGIGTEDFGSDDVLAGISLQRHLERKAYKYGGGNYHAPVQKLGDFLSNNKTVSFGSVLPSYKPGVEMCDLNGLLPEYMSISLKEGIMMMNERMSCFADNDAVLTAIESRSSSPVRILRDETMQSVSMKGLYPCGEGAGYAGGIMSAAVDGIKAAEMILTST